MIFKMFKNELFFQSFKGNSFCTIEFSFSLSFLLFFFCCCCWSFCFCSSSWVSIKFCNATLDFLTWFNWLQSIKSSLSPNSFNVTESNWTLSENLIDSQHTRTGIFLFFAVIAIKAAPTLEYKNPLDNIAWAPRKTVSTSWKIEVIELIKAYWTFNPFEVRIFANFLPSNKGLESTIITRNFFCNSLALYKNNSFNTFELPNVKTVDPFWIWFEADWMINLSDSSIFSFKKISIFSTRSFLASISEVSIEINEISCFNHLIALPIVTDNGLEVFK